MEKKRRESGAAIRQKIEMLVCMAFGFVLVVLIGVASADETPSSNPPALPVELASAVVVAAGADSLDVDAVSRVSAEYADATERGTAVQLDDGRVATVAHVLLDARAVRVDDITVEPDAVTITREHDLASIDANPGDTGLSLASEPAAVGDSVVMAGISQAGRIEVVPTTVISRTSGAGYGIGRPDVYVLSARAELGWSGGPVVNVAGDVVAIIVGVEQVSGVTLAVPVEYLP